MATWAEATVRAVVRAGAWISVAAICAVPVALAVGALRPVAGAAPPAALGFELVVTTLAVCAIATIASTFLGMSAAALAAELLPTGAGRGLREFASVVARTPAVVAGTAAALAFPLLRDAPPAARIAELSMILTLAISPVVTNVVYQALRGVPFRLREAVVACGATGDFALTHAFLPSVQRALTGAATFAAARALGEGALVAIVAGASTLAASLLMQAVRIQAVPAGIAAETLLLLGAVVALNVAGRRLARYRQAS